MSDETDITQRPGWKAVERWLKENEPPPHKTPMREPIGKWGTRGLIAGGTVAFVFLTAGNVIAGDSSLKGLLAYPILMGILAIPCAIAGMLVGFVVWIWQRK
jgi:hypothetical protein